MTETYDLKSVKLPRMSGIILQMFTNLLESPLTRWLLLNNLLKQGGFLAMRELQVDEPPSFFPPVPRSGYPVAEGRNNQVLDDLIYIKTGTQEGFHFNTIMDYASAYRNGTISPEMVAERILAAIDESQANHPSMNIFIAWMKDDLLAQARAATERIRSGKP